jgi:AGCS family alanine or glycine:cation symporter
MATLNHLIDNVVSFLWSTPTFFIVFAMGVLFTVWSKFVQYHAWTHGIALLRGKYDDRRDPGAINHFQALSTALSGTVGLGNIGGVAIAIALGGPGALFWMWMAGLFGMAIKATEVTLAMIYRDTTDPDNPRGGAMYVITRGWGDRIGGAARPVSYAMGGLFSAALLLAAFMGGNMFQSWNVANITSEYFGVPQVASGIVMAVVTGLTIIGGIKRIGDVTAWLTPGMCALYLLAGCVVLVVKAADVPAMLALIVEEAFSPTSAQGAFLGATTWFGITTGLQRALFSNEAGQGSSPVAHSAAKTSEPAREGIVAGLEPFVDTCLVCTLTALVILSTGTWNRESIGRFGGDVAVVQSGNRSWSVEGPTTVEALPKLPAPDVWSTGNSFFLLAETPQVNVDRGTKRVKIVGDVTRVADDPQGGLQITWRTPPEGAKIVDGNVYRELTGAALTGHAFDRAVPGLGKYLVTLTCWLFAVSTLISWSYYGEQATVFLVGQRFIVPYKLAFCVAIVVASFPQFVQTDRQLGNLADLGAGCMLATNAPIILLMSGRAMRCLRDYLSRLARGDFHAHKAPPLVDVMEGHDVE